MDLMEIYNVNERISSKMIDVGKGYILKCPVSFGFEAFENSEEMKINTSNFFLDKDIDYFNYYEAFNKLTIEDYFKNTNNFLYKDFMSEILIEEKKKIGTLSFYGLKCLYLFDVLPEYQLIITGSEGMSTFSIDRYLFFLKIIQKKMLDRSIVFLLVSTINNEYEILEINDLI